MMVIFLKTCFLRPGEGFRGDIDGILLVIEWLPLSRPPITREPIMKTYAALFALCVLAVLMMSVQPSHAGINAGGNGAEKENAYLPVVDVMPEPVGGIAAIARKVVYPEAAKKFGIEGKVYLVAYINESGDVDDVKVLKGLQGGCDEAATKALKETKFNPGKQGGTAVKSQLSIPISFKIAK
jgi:protein TonB